MPTNVETGLLPGPEGEVVTYSREEVTPEAALFRGQAEGQRYRVLTYRGNADGGAARRMRRLVSTHRNTHPPATVTGAHSGRVRSPGGIG